MSMEIATVMASNTAGGNTPRSSTIDKRGNTPRSSTVHPEIAALDRVRNAKRMPHAELCRRAEIDHKHWIDLRAGRVQPRDAMIARIKRALAGTAPRVPPDVIAATHRFAMVWLAQEAGDDVEAIMAQDFAAERPQNPMWLRAARLRSYAIYITAVELRVPNSAIGNAIGCSRQNIKQRRDWVEDQRDDPKLNELLDRCARLAVGRPR